MTDPAKSAQEHLHKTLNDDLHAAIHGVNNVKINPGGLLQTLSYFLIRRLVLFLRR